MIDMSYEVIAHGVASVHVPTYVTVMTGKNSDDPEVVTVLTLRGNKEGEPIYSGWVPMHGVRATYDKDGSHKKTTIYDDSKVTFRTTGAWKLEVQKPA